VLLRNERVGPGRVEAPVAAAKDGDRGRPPPDKVDIREDKARLVYFDLKNAGLIPSCMVQDVQVAASSLWTVEDTGKATPSTSRSNGVLRLNSTK